MVIMEEDLEDRRVHANPIDALNRSKRGGAAGGVPSSTAAASGSDDSPSTVGT